jgi:hypothetical protein
MPNPDYTRFNIMKSRFAGFFAFLLLVGCQPAPDSQSDLMRRAKYEPAAAISLASQRLAAAEYDAALFWFRQAAELGSQQGLQHALQLQQREQGRLATANWLQQQLDEGRVSATAVSAAQRAELGLWEQNHTVIAGFLHPEGCKITLRPIVSQQAGVDSWQHLLQQWQLDSQLSKLPVCFLALQTVNSTELACSDDGNSLVQCRYHALNNLVAAGGFSQLLVIAGRGKASYNNGILHLPDNASLALLRHEFMHLLGFVDEYPLSAHSAEQVCQPGKYYPNLIIGTDISAYLQQYQLTVEDIELTSVQSCQLSKLQSYRVVATANLMRSYELELPALYFRLAQQILQQPQQIMPVQYYFAYLARQQQNWHNWQLFMQQASALGYAEAQQALAP